MALVNDRTSDAILGADRAEGHDTTEKVCGTDTKDELCVGT